MEKTQAQHTPGPWKVSGSGDTVVGPRGNVVAECCGYSVEATDSAQRAQGGREANARLIAAAPDLLADGDALVDRVIDFLDEGNAARGAALVSAMQAMAATVRKARGEAPAATVYEHFITDEEGSR